MTYFESYPYPNDKITAIFGELSIDKTRLPSSKLTESGVPSYVAEWLLDKIVPGFGSLSQEEFEKVYEFVNKYFPRKDDKNLIHFRLTQGETQQAIALMQVHTPISGGKLRETVAKIPILNFDYCIISPLIIEQNQQLLKQGLWGRIKLALDPEGQPEIIEFDPFQSSDVDLQIYQEYRAEFTTEEWRDLFFCSMGFNPQHPDYTPTAKTWILARLLPIVEPNYHLLELAPKGTSKSYVYENVSSKVKVISGGKITPAVLFFNGKTQEEGLLARHDVVVLDEVQSLTFNNPDEVIGPLKTYLASGRFNRGGYGDIASDCSLAMLANIELNEDLQPRHPNNLIANLPKFFSETALLDRFCGIIPGWEIPKFKQEMTASQIGLKMDFFGEALLSLRTDNRYFAYAKEHTHFYNRSVRDQNAILKSAAGFLKILYPHLELTVTEYEENCLKPARHLRQYVFNSLYLDQEFKQYDREISVNAI